MKYDKQKLMALLQAIQQGVIDQAHFDTAMQSLIEDESVTETIEWRATPIRVRGRGATSSQPTPDQPIQITKQSQAFEATDVQGNIVKIVLQLSIDHDNIELIGSVNSRTSLFWKMAHVLLYRNNILEDYETLSENKSDFRLKITSAGMIVLRVIAPSGQNIVLDNLMIVLD